MRLKLKEEPLEWSKFVWVWCAVFVIVFGLLFWRGKTGGTVFFVVLAAAGILSLAAGIAPGRFRWLYRAGMTGSFYVGQAMGRVMLSLIFCLLFVPLGLLLRAVGRDPLALRRPRGARTFWREAKPPSRFDLQF